jgi:hypothetical protein
MPVLVVGGNRHADIELVDVDEHVMVPRVGRVDARRCHPHAGQAHHYLQRPGHGRAIFRLMK